MGNIKQPVVMQFPFTLDFLVYMLRQHAPSTVVVCSSREVFFQQLLNECWGDRQDNSTSTQRLAGSASKDYLLTPTLHLLAESRTVRLVYVPTVSHLRAYLATFALPTNPIDKVTSYEKPSTHVSTLALFNPLALHRSTADFSAQGLSRTFALSVEAAAREGMRLLITECFPFTQPEEIPMDEIEGAEVQRDLWTEQIPLLNGSIRFGGEERLWAGRTVEVRKVASRWCKFVDNGQDNNED